MYDVPTCEHKEDGGIWETVPMRSDEYVFEILNTTTGNNYSFHTSFYTLLLCTFLILSCLKPCNGFFSHTFPLLDIIERRSSSSTHQNLLRVKPAPMTTHSMFFGVLWHWPNHQKLLHWRFVVTVAPPICEWDCMSQVNPTNHSLVVLSCNWEYIHPFL